MFERFTERARQVVVIAQEEARGLGHHHIGTEHLLLGLLREEEGVAARTLANLGVQADDVRGRLTEAVGGGTEAPADRIPFTPSAKKVLELSLREALALGHNHIGTEHLLLAVVRVDGVGCELLQEAGADPGTVRAEVLSQLSGMPAGPRRRGRRMRPRWEYLVTAVEPEGLTQERLNELGADGWALDAVVGSEAIFRRRA